MFGERCTLVQLVAIRKGQQINGEFLSESGTYKVLNGGINLSGAVVIAIHYSPIRSV